MAEKPTYEELEKRIQEIEQGNFLQHPADRNEKENKSRYSHLKVLIKIGALVNSTLDLEEVLQGILKSTLETVNASAGMIFLKDSVTGGLSWGASSGLSKAFISKFQNKYIQVGEGLTGQIAQTGELIYIPVDYSHDPRIARPMIEEEGLNSFIGVPIYAGDKIVGVMNILTHPPDILSEYDMYLCEAIGSHVGLAIRNAQLFNTQKQIANELKESEHKLATHLQNTPVGAISWDLNFKTIEWNSAAETIFGYSKKEAMGKHVAELIVPEKLKELIDSVFHKLKSEKGGVRSKNENRTKDGRQIICDWYNTTLKNADGKVIGVAALVNEITESELALEALKKQKEFNEKIVQTSNAIIVGLDKNHKIKIFNKGAEKITGFKAKEVIGSDWFEIFVEPDISDEINKVWEIAWGAEINSYINPIRSKNGDKKIVSWQTTGMYDGADETTHLLISIGEDITERTRAEELLKESEEKHRLLFENAGDAIFIHDAEGRMLAINPMVCELLGYTYEELMSMTIDQIDTPEEVQHAPDRIAQVMANGHLTFETVHQHKDSSLQSGWVSARLISWEGQPAIMSICRDTTERKQAEDALRESEGRFRTLFESVPAAMQGYNSDGTIHYWNKACEKTYGYTKEEAIGKNLIDLIIPPEMRNFVRKAIKQSSKTGEMPPPEEISLMQKDGSLVPVLSSHALVKLDGKEPELYCLDIDMRLQKKLESQLQQAQKMESIGTLAGGIAHDFNNLLFVVLGNISLAQDDLKYETGTSESLKAAEEACIKAKELTARLITFSKGGDPVKKKIPIGDLLKNTVISALKEFNIKSKISILDAIRQVNIDEGQIKQVFRNIIVNAREAMDDNEQLTVSCEKIDIAENSSLKLSQGEYIKISFEDQGCGISKENLKKIFDPYFTTKDMGINKGQGLGLTVSYAIIKKHEGLITAESEQGKGSTFSVYLPAISVKKTDPQKSVKNSETLKSIKQPATGKRKILLMDDEEAIRKFMDLVLNKLGYDVKICAEGNEAVQIYKKAIESKEPFDVVILDLTNKLGMGGQETMRRLLEIDPNTKGIVITGYSSDPVVSNYSAYGFSGFLAKPATKDELNKVISEVVSKNQ